VSLIFSRLLRLEASEEVRLALECLVLEKEPLGKDLMLKLPSKDLSASFEIADVEELSSEIGGSGH